MTEQPLDAWENLTPRQQRCILLYTKNKLSKWKCAKLAGYQGKTKSTLAATTTEVLQKYELEASKEEKFRRTGITILHWVRNLYWLERVVKARKDTKGMSTWLKDVGESEPIGLLKKKGETPEVGATIVLVQGGEAQEPKEEKKRASVVCLPGAKE